MTWDGTTQLPVRQRHTRSGTRAASGSSLNSAGALRFGGNNVWDEWFSGRLDEVRIYDRALTRPRCSPT